MTITSDSLQALMVAALTRQDDAGHYPTGAADKVYAPRDWPTVASLMPVILVQSPTERKTGMGRSGAPQFTVTTTLRVVARVYALADTGDSGAVAALAATSVLQRQIEVAVINDYDLRASIQQYTTIEVTNEVKRDGEMHFGELVMDFSLEFYQGPEDFAPIVSDAIAELAIYGDLLNVFDPTGTYDPDLEPFDAATDAPRTEGPDGRPEISALIELPQ